MDTSGAENFCLKILNLFQLFLFSGFLPFGIANLFSIGFQLFYGCPTNF
jgi:hypothetical protein